MGSLNKVMLIGHLGGDPEVRHTNTGKIVANFNIATSYKSGKDEVTEWHRIVAWAQLAELAQTYLVKGRQIYLEGRLQTEKWEDKDGGKRETIKIIATSLVFLGKGPGDASDGGASPAPAIPSDGRREYPPLTPAEKALGSEDIPF